MLASINFYEWFWILTDEMLKVALIIFDNMSLLQFWIQVYSKQCVEEVVLVFESFAFSIIDTVHFCSSEVLQIVHQYVQSFHMIFYLSK